MSLLPSAFEEVLCAVLDGTADDRQRQELRRWLKERPELLELYIDQGETHAALLTIAGTEREAAAEHAAEACVGRTWGKRVYRAAAAAAVLAGATLFLKVSLRENVNLTPEPAEVNPGPSPIRVICQEEVSGLELPERLPGNVRLQSGLARIRLLSGVELVLHGPVELLVESGMETRLRAGELMAWVPKRASGFTVRAPGLTVWDIGTLFSVSADDAGSSLLVFKGSVQALDGQGDGIDICAEGECVLALANRTPVKVMADAAGTRELFGAFRGEKAWTDPPSTFAVARKIMLELGKQCLPVVRPDSAPISEENEMSSRMSQTMTSAALALAIVSATDAQTAWKSPEDGLWTNAAAWTAGLPEGNAALLTNTAASYAVGLETATTPIWKLSVSNSAPLTTTLNVNEGGVLTVTNGAIAIDAGAKVCVRTNGCLIFTGIQTSDADGFLKVMNGGMLRVDGGTVCFTGLAAAAKSALVGFNSPGAVFIASGVYTQSFGGTPALQVGKGTSGSGYFEVSGSGRVAVTNFALGVGGSAAQPAQGTLVLKDNAHFTVTSSVDSPAIPSVVDAGAVNNTGTVIIADNAVLEYRGNKPGQDFRIAYDMSARAVTNYGSLLITGNGCYYGTNGWGTISCGGYYTGAGKGVIVIESNGCCYADNLYLRGNSEMTVKDNGRYVAANSNYGATLTGCDRGAVLNVCGNGRFYAAVGFIIAGKTDTTPRHRSEINLSGNGLIAPNNDSGYGLTMAQVTGNTGAGSVESCLNISGGVFDLTKSGFYGGSWEEGIKAGVIDLGKSGSAVARINLSGGSVTNSGNFNAGMRFGATGIVCQTGGTLIQSVRRNGTFSGNRVALGWGGGYGEYNLSNGAAMFGGDVYIGGVASNQLGYANSETGGSVGLLRVDGGTFAVTNNKTLYCGSFGTGTITLGTGGVCVAKNIVLTNNPQSVVRFELGPQGCGLLKATSVLTILPGTRLEVNARVFKGTGQVKLIDYPARSGEFAAENITVTGGTVVQDDTGVWLHASRGTVMQLL